MPTRTLDEVRQSRREARAALLAPRPQPPVERAKPGHCYIADALAVSLRAFARMVAQDRNTHDGEPRGEDWRESAQEASYRSLMDEAERLDNLSTLWDLG